MCCIVALMVLNFFTSELVNMSNFHDSFLFSKTKTKTILVPYKIGFEFSWKQSLGLWVQQLMQMKTAKLGQKLDSFRWYRKEGELTSYKRFFFFFLIHFIFNKGNSLNANSHTDCTIHILWKLKSFMYGS